MNLSSSSRRFRRGTLNVIPNIIPNLVRSNNNDQTHPSFRKAKLPLNLVIEDNNERMPPEQIHSEKDIIAITVSSNYDDLLDIILPQNRNFFKKWFIVTDENDTKTIDMVKKYNFENVELLYYNFYNNATFNKGGAIRYAQQKVDELGFSDFLMLFLDSDIYLPSNFQHIVRKCKINNNTIYGSLKREDYHSYENFINNVNDNNIVENMSMGWVSGYFQLYNYSPTYKYQDSQNCSSCDVQFSNLFSSYIFINDLIVKHLGKAGVNWDVRKDKTDFLMNELSLDRLVHELRSEAAQDDADNIVELSTLHNSNQYKIKFYLIHGVDPSRKDRMISEFNKANVPLDNITWILHPNKDELSDELKKSICSSDSSTKITDGMISCSYKHYLALKDFCENDHDYAVIFEDNIFFTNRNVLSRIELYIEQLNKLYTDWDILFDSNYLKYSEQQLLPDLFVYPKNVSNDGGSRLAQCYLLSKKCARKYVEHYLPFDNPPDFWMNHLNKTLGINVFWSEPPVSNTFPHTSTVLS